MITLTVITVMRYFDRNIRYVINKTPQILWSLVMGLTGCDHTIESIPIALHRAGTVVETDVVIKQDDRIYLRLEFLVNDQPGDRDRLLTFLGGFGEVGTPISIKVEITKYVATKNEIFLQKIYTTTAPMIIGSDFFERTIVELSIPSGKYRMSLETLEDFPQLSETPVQFKLGYIRVPK